MVFLSQSLRDALLKMGYQVMIRSIFLYMDRTYLMQTSGLKSLWDTGLELFRGNVMDDLGIQRGVVQEILRLILKDR